MPDIIVFALKLIGYILLAALCLAFLLICLVLFAPLKYRAEVFVKNEAGCVRVNLTFSWLLHLISGRFSCSGKKAEWHVRIAWKRLPSEREGKKEPKWPEESAVPPSSEGKAKVGKKAEEEKEAAPAREENAGKKSAPAFEPKAAEGKGKEPSEKKKPLKVKLKDKAGRVYDIIESLKGKTEAVRGFLADNVHKAAFLKLIKEAKIFLLHIKPEKIAGYVCYGLEDPAATGEIFAFISILYPLLGGELAVAPVFNEKRIEADIEANGSLRAVYAVTLALRLIINKNIRATIRHIKKLINKVKD